MKTRAPGGKGERPAEGRILYRAAGPLALAVALALALLIGRYPSPGILDPRLILSDPLARTILLKVRLPRALAALLLGSVLGASGNAFQMIFGNPLVEPGFLGVSQGAAFGAALAMVLGFKGGWAITALAFFFAMASLGLSILLAEKFKFGGQVLRLVLSGIAVSALASSALALVKYLADPLKQLPDIVFWTMGGLSGAGWPSLLGAAPLALLGLFMIWLFRWRLSLLSLDDPTAFSLGAAPGRERLFLLIVSVAATASMTAISGLTAWTGLLIPHIARRLAGQDGRASVPASIFLGAAFMLVCDTLSRSLLPGELPLGIVTSFLGASLFALLLSRGAVRVTR